MACKACECLADSETIKLYEDDKVVIIMPKDGCVKGHLKIFTKEHLTEITEVDDEFMNYLMLTASFASTAVFEYLGVQGTNIILNEGHILETENHLCFDVVPRTFEDGLEIKWDPKKLEEDQQEKVLNQLKDKAFFIDGEKKEVSEEVKVSDEKDVKQIKADDKGEDDDYRIKDLRRIP